MVASAEWSIISGRDEAIASHTFSILEKLKEIVRKSRKGNALNSRRIERFYQIVAIQTTTKSFPTIYIIFQCNVILLKFLEKKIPIWFIDNTMRRVQIQIRIRDHPHITYEHQEGGRVGRKTYGYVLGGRDVHENAYVIKRMAFWRAQRIGIDCVIPVDTLWWPYTAIVIY